MTSKFVMNIDFNYVKIEYNQPNTYLIDETF